MNCLKKELVQEQQACLQPFVGRATQNELDAWNSLEGISSGVFICGRPEDNWEKEHDVYDVFWIMRAIGNVEAHNFGEQIGEMQTEPGFLAE